MKPEELSRYLREGDDADLVRRRLVVGLSLIGAGMGQLVAAYQVGLVPHLPDPPGPFDSDRVDASSYAYRRLSSPDGPAMVISYAVTAALAAAGGPDRPRGAPLLPVFTLGKVIGDLVLALELAREEWRENRALCAYCQLATLASAVSLPLALPEAARAVRRLRRS